MDEIKKMLRAVINGQSALREEMLKKFDEVEQRFDRLDKKVDVVEMRLSKRIDKIGKQVAYLEDDTPTRNEHDILGKRVSKVEKKLASF